MFFTYLKLNASFPIDFDSFKIISKFNIKQQ